MGMRRLQDTWALCFIRDVTVSREQWVSVPPLCARKGVANMPDMRRNRQIEAHGPIDTTVEANVTCL